MRRTTYLTQGTGPRIRPTLPQPAPKPPTSQPRLVKKGN
jgi:hypothetical protein